MKNGLVGLFVVALLAVWSAEPVFGQAYRVQPRPLQQGNALDANPRVGSGGSNAGAGIDANAYNIQSQLYVTGQVRGLGNFKGPVPYVAADQFRIDVPSAGLSDFVGRSTGLPDVRTGQVLAPTPYYAPSRTIVGPAAIQAGINQPGSNMPKPNVVAPGLSSRYYVDGAVQQYTPVVPRADGTLLATPLERVPLDPTPREIREARGWMPDLIPVLSSDQPLGANQPGQPLASTPTGVRDMLEIVTPQDRQALASDLYTLELQQRVNEGVDASVLPGASLNERSAVEARPGLPLEAPARPQPVIPGDGQNVLLDLLEELNEQARQEEGLPEDPLRPKPQARPENPAVENVDGIIVLNRFTGSGSDRANAAMAEADRRLRLGDYYQAVYQYRIAQAGNRNNPLPQVGMGLAYFAAGEPITAATRLRAAFSMLPPLMKTRLDIPKFVDENVVRAQLQRLDEVIARQGDEKPDAAMVFVAAYMHANLGNAQQARQYAQLLKELAPEDELYVAYADHVLGDKPAEE
ncbi:MAG: hypothetical protein GXY38_05715 [Planctomycetes bacterium]|nr:hypothetical protein [Planctomycetota bacterium]